MNEGLLPSLLAVRDTHALVMAALVSQACGDERQECKGLDDHDGGARKGRWGRHEKNAAQFDCWQHECCVVNPESAAPVPESMMCH
eukprot:153778-Rhodomonas_salina.2